MPNSEDNKSKQNPSLESPDGKTENANVSADVALEDFASALTFDAKNGGLKLTTSKQDAADKPNTKNGPIAPNSKRLGNKNSLMHGVYSSEVILPWESADEFEKLRKAFRAEWKPNGYSEEHAVLDVTYYTWMKWRSIKSAQLRFFKCSLPDDIKRGEDTWEDMIEWQKKVPKRGENAIAHAGNFMNKLQATFEHVRSHHYWTEDSEGKDVQMKLLLLQRDISSLIEEAETKVIANVERLAAAMTEVTTYLDRVYEPDEIEKQVDLMAKLDARIEKAIRRLIAIKVFKRVDGVEAPATYLHSPPMVPDAIEAPTETSERTEINATDSTGRKPVADAAPKHRKVGKSKS